MARGRSRPLAARTTRLPAQVFHRREHRGWHDAALYYSSHRTKCCAHEIMEKEFLALAETEGIADIEELNKILNGR